MVVKNKKKRKLILDRLQLLLNLCYNTIPDETENILFHEHMIEAEKMTDLVRDEERWNDLYPDEIANIMVNANRIWKIRNKMDTILGVVITVLFISKFLRINWDSILYLWN